jgi:hypothetical protein
MSTGWRGILDSPAGVFGIDSREVWLLKNEPKSLKNNLV